MLSACCKGCSSPVANDPKKVVFVGQHLVTDVQNLKEHKRTAHHDHRVDFKIGKLSCASCDLNWGNVQTNCKGREGLPTAFLKRVNITIVKNSEQKGAKVQRSASLDQATPLLHRGADGGHRNRRFYFTKPLKYRSVYAASFIRLSPERL